MSSDEDEESWLCVEKPYGHKELNGRPCPAGSLIGDAQRLDVQRLGPTLWLNDAIINFFGEVFALTMAKWDSNSECLLLSTQFFTLLERHED